jgi:hypothetical protein
VLSHLLVLALGFELQVGGPKNIWLISGVVLRLHTSVVTWRYITFADGGQGRVTSEEMIKVSEFVTFKCVAFEDHMWFEDWWVVASLCDE